jgi:hypothetical protein
MKNIIKFAFVLVSLVFAQQASAACYDNAGKVPAGSPPLHLRNGLWCTEEQPQVGVQVLGRSSAIYIPNGVQAPQGYCSWSDRVLNIGISTLIGGFLGALATDTSRGAGQGGALGGSAGMFIPCGQAAQAPRNLENQGSQGGQQAGVTQGIACSTGSKTFLVSSIEDCARRAMEIAQAATPQTVTGTVVGTPPSCVVNSKTEKFRFNAVKGVKINREQCDRYVKEVDPLPSKEDMSIVM